MRFFSLLFLALFLSPFAFAESGHEGHSLEGHSHGGHSHAFDSIFFIIAFGTIGVGLYASEVDKRGKKPSVLEFSAAFFAGYFFLSFLFELFLTG